MEIIPFKDYSGVLIPLPPLGRDVPTTAESSPRGENFPAYLRQAEQALSQRERTRESSSPRIPRGSTATKSEISSNPQGKDEEKLMEACRELEGFLIAILLRTMGRALSEEGFFGESFESKIYRDMFFAEIAATAAKSGRGLGIAELIYKDINLKAESLRRRR